MTPVRTSLQDLALMSESGESAGGLPVKQFLLQLEGAWTDGDLSTVQARPAAA